MAGEARERRGCGCRREDFLPEKSFESWGNYGQALKATPARFLNRLMTRSLEQTEMLEVKSRSQHEMKKTLTWWDIMCFSFGSVLGCGIFVLIGTEVRVAGPAIVVSFIISGFSAMLSVFCYTEFAVEIPVAGGSFAYIRVELGDFLAFIAAGNILLEYMVGGAAVARSCTSYLATLFNFTPSSFRIHIHSLGDDYGHLDPIAVALIIAVSVVSITGIKGSSRLNYASTIVHMLIIVFIIAMGLSKADLTNYSPFSPHNPDGIIQASAVIFFSYVGFDAVLTMAEEIRTPEKDIPMGLVGSMSIISLVYCLMSITLCLMQPYNSIDVDVAFSAAFKHVGMDWAKYVIALGSITGLFNVHITSIISQARYLTHIARTHMIPPWFAHVNAHTGTPVNATIITSIVEAVIALFTNLSILANILSISTLFIFTLVPVALLVRRYYTSGETSISNRNKLIFFIFLIVLSSFGTSITYQGLGKTGWGEFCVTIPIWVLATWGLSAFVPRAKRPRVWGVPLVPWLPSTSILINMFLLGFMDKSSFIIFGILTLLLLVYYVFVGLHPSFDSAMGSIEASASDVVSTTVFGRVEEGEDVFQVHGM